MSKNEEIIVIIGPDGKIVVEAKGYTGKSCKEATAFLNELGTTVDHKERPEMNKRQKKKDKQIKKGRG